MVKDIYVALRYGSLRIALDVAAREAAMNTRMMGPIERADEVAELDRERAGCFAAGRWADALDAERDISCEVATLRCQVGAEESFRLIEDAEWGWL